MFGTIYGLPYWGVSGHILKGNIDICPCDEMSACRLFNLIQFCILLGLIPFFDNSTLLQLDNLALFQKEIQPYSVNPLIIIVHIF